MILSPLIGISAHHQRSVSVAESRNVSCQRTGGRLLDQMWGWVLPAWIGSGSFGHQPAEGRIHADAGVRAFLRAQYLHGRRTQRQRLLDQDGPSVLVGSSQPVGEVAQGGVDLGRLDKGT